MKPIHKPCDRCGHKGKVTNGICRQVVGAECLDPYGEECGCKCDDADEAINTN